MHKVYLKDGSEKVFDSQINGIDLALSLSKSLEKKAVAMKVNGDLKDLTTTIPNDALVDIVTKDDDEGLDILRHDAAHIFAQAIKELYPETQITIGPSIKDGFYYDVYREEKFSTDDFEKIEKKMADIVDQDIPFIREEWDRNDAIKFFKEQGEHFKAELIESIPEGDVISLYRQGSFIDLCRGPHMPSTKKIGKAFKLMKVAGAYWRGDSNNQMLQRIYGTAWANDKDLKKYLTQLEEAEKRDHRKLGAQLDLFHFQDDAPGSAFWHTKGWTIYQTLKDFLRKKLDQAGYEEVNTPVMLDRTLWEKSGHWDKFRENMYTSEYDDRTYAVKPMSCPGHVQIYNQGIKSYRDLPLRMAEFGLVHRNEPSGALHGLMRVRAFTQDDAHIFCTPEQVVEETKAFCDLLKDVYKDLGFEELRIKFSDRPEKRAGDDNVWDMAEAALKEASEAAELEYSYNPGEGAFYGPKLEFVLRDAIGRDWQCGTLQVDFVLPERLDATYIGEDGQKHRPVFLHRAVFGSLERIIGILIEHHAGAFPFWLAPTQVAVASIIDDAIPYAKDVVQKLKAKGIRVVSDYRNEKISYKVREHSLQKIPYILAIGQKEAEQGTVAVRTFGSKEQKFMPLDDFIKNCLDS